MSGPTPVPRVLLDREELTARVTGLARRIAADHPDGVVLVGVLKGALVFLADLARAIRGVDVQLDFLAISRYAPDSGRVRILQDLELDVAGRDVVLVEDLVDTGLTLAYLLQHVRDRGPRRVELCALLDRSARRIVPLDIRYVGIELAADAFVLGYGLHYAERYRNLPVVVAVDQATVLENPDAYLGVYHRAWSTRAGDGAGPSAATSGEGVRDPR